MICRDGIAQSSIGKLVLASFLLAGFICCGGCRGCKQKDNGSTVDPGAAGQVEKVEPSYGDTLVEGSIGDARSLNPIIVSDNASFDVIGLIFNGLVKYDKDLNMVGDLAESWDISEDGLVYTFHLRKGVKWHDGEEFTAEDVEFTFLKTMDPDVNSLYRSEYELVDRVEVVDDYTFRVFYQEVFAPCLESWSLEIVPKHILKDVDINTTNFNRSPIGTGPFRFKEWIQEERIVLEAFDDYFEGRPYLDRYVYRVIPDKSIMFLELKNGGVDMMDLKPDQFQKRGSTAAFQGQFYTYRYPSFGYTYLGYNLNHPILKDLAVREAITYAINRDEIIETIIWGLGQELTGPFHPSSWAYNPAVKKRDYDPVKAEEILKQAGWRDSDDDGWLDRDIGGDGELDRLEFTLTTNHGNKNRELTAQIVKYNLRKIGMKVDVEMIAWVPFCEDYVDAKNYDAVILGWSLPVDPDCYNMWHSSCIESGNNITSYRNDRVDVLLEKGRTTIDRTTRKKYYYEIHEIIARELPYTFLFSRDSLVAVNKRFRGIDVSKVGIKHNLIRWYVPAAEQKYKR